MAFILVIGAIRGDLDKGGVYEISDIDIRQFEVPNINIKAEHYSELLHWERDHQRTEPPITMAISKQALCACIRDEKKLAEKLFDFPCHTQAVERCIKLVTEASSKVYGKNSRDGFVREQWNRAGKCHDLSQRKT